MSMRMTAVEEASSGAPHGKEYGADVCIASIDDGACVVYDCGVGAVRPKCAAARPLMRRSARRSAVFEGAPCVPFLPPRAQ